MMLNNSVVVHICLYNISTSKCSFGSLYFDTPSGEHDIFGEVSSSDEEKDINVMDSDNEGLTRVDTAMTDLSQISLGGDTNMSADGETGTKYKHYYKMLS